MDYQHPHGYMRPPQPHAPQSPADPYQRPPPLPPNHSWPSSFSSPPPQFHYQTPQFQPQHSDHAPYPAHPPYPVHPPYPPPPPHALPPRPPHLPQSYSQDWGNGSWSHHQSWEYPKNNNEEDWAAKARAWAAAKSATDNQIPPSQFIPPGRPEDQNHFRDPYSQPIDPHFSDAHTPLAPASNYQHQPVGMEPPNRPDMHAPYTAGDGSLAGDSTAPYPHQEKSSIRPYIHQQEVPSSYSSVAGNQEVRDRYESFNSSPSLPVASNMQYPVQPLPPAVGRSGWMEEPHQSLGGQPGSVTDLRDQPLTFAPHFNRGSDPHVQHSYTHSSGGPVTSNYAWAPSSAPGPVYPPLPPTMSSGPQVDHPIAMHSPASGHSASVFPTGPGFQPTVPMMGASFGVGPGVTPHPTPFSGDAYGVSDRPKKASVPNWLREEIIKNKAVIASSAPEIPKEDSRSLEEDNIDKSSRKGDQADSKSIDSSRSTEDEDEDEDEVEAARTAAINQEIKRVLTEVLLKVTDELFDEIATKVLKEDDLSVEVDRDVDLSNHQVLPNTPSTLTPKASAKVLIPTKMKESDNEDASEKSTSGAPGDILGLGSYESDEEIQSADKLNMEENSTHQQSSSKKLPEGNTVVDNVGSQDETEKQNNVPTELEMYKLGPSDDGHSTGGLSAVEDELPHGSDITKAKNSLIEKISERNEKADEKLDARRLTNDDYRTRNSGNRSGKNDRHDSESVKERVDKKGDEGHKKNEERRSRTERMDHHSNLKDKEKEKGRSEKVKSSESRKRPSPSEDTRRVKRTNGKEDSDEKRRDGTGDDKKERSRHKSGSESSRHKRHRSNDSGDESSDDSKRKTHHSRRRRSPSPIRSKKRQVSRSPHSKHSKRRHSPYSSLETTRGKRSVSGSRSRSPVHRRRY